MKPRTIGLLVALVAASTANCSPAPEASEKAIENCLTRVGEDHRYLGALERAVMGGKVYTRTNRAADGRGDLFTLIFDDNRSALAVFTTPDRLATAIKGELTPAQGAGTEFRIAGKDLAAYSAEGRIVLNYGSQATVEWEKGTFGEAAAKPDLPRNCPPA
ncbi:hypothetical protein [Caulobacter sp. NIBR1757]|uniref:hypothetical protein n=1 Tax=Caulobacter sp. NIBR1757 TaxID=3016000 RepID=UPI0022F10612|nr:hypothetical protein [Caulobacter sp. NIBR1757]WGM39655.1 hypothetical protein AMEJIAPC_02580 [Caulobacter sp. NIBR1757]